MGWCGDGLLNSRAAVPEMSVAAAVFSPFTMITLLIDPYDFGGRAFDPLIADADPTGARVTAFIMCIAAIAAYALLVWSMYRSMVKNFDMTIRKQAR